MMKSELCVFNLVNFIFISSLFFFKLNEPYTFSKQDVKIALDLLEEAELANISKIIWLARAPVFRRGDIKAIDYQGKINRVLTTSKIPFTIVRPTLFFNELTIFFEQARKGKVYLPCYGQNKINPIYIGEFASICISSIYSDRKHKTVGGGEVFTCWEILELMYKLLDQPPKISFISTALYKAYISLCCLFQPDKTAAFKKFKLRILTNDIIGRPVGKNSLFDFFSEKVEQDLGINPNPYFKIGNYKEKRI